MSKAIYIVLITFLMFLTACTPDVNKGITILNKSIESHGGTKFKTSKIKFNINEITYEMEHDGDRKIYTMSQIFKNGLHEVRYDSGSTEYFVNDTLKPNGTYNNNIVSIRLEGFLYTTNIPHYFTTNDIIVTQLEDASIRSKNYHAVLIEFIKIPNTPENSFILYINPETFIIDYAALNYELLGSIQFRRMLNPRRIDGILFHDFIGFTRFEKDSIPFKNLYKRYNQGQLNALKKVIYDSIEVLNKNDF